MSIGTTEQLLASNTPELPTDELAAAPPTPANLRTIESLWPKHTCGKSETAVGISMCSYGAAVGMMVLYGLCNFKD